MHLFLKAPILMLCSKCKKPLKPHIVCKYCGFYNNKEVVDILGKLTKKERKQREKEMKTKEKEGGKDKPMTMEGLSKK